MHNHLKYFIQFIFGNGKKFLDFRAINEDVVIKFGGKFFVLLLGDYFLGHFIIPGYLALGVLFASNR